MFKARRGAAKGIVVEVLVVVVVWVKVVSVDVLVRVPAVACSQRSRLEGFGR